MNININKVKIRSLLLALALNCYIGVSAQRGDVYNKGTLYVSPNTVFTAEANFVNQATGVYINDGEVLFRKNFRNDGVTSFSKGLNGYTRFEGAQESQEIGGSAKADFYDILFDNGSQRFGPSFLLSGNIAVSGKADFYRGIVDNYTSNGIFSFNEDALSIAVSDESYVEGKVNKIGKSTFVYPIGKQNMYRPASVVFLGDDTSVVQIAGEYQAYNSNSEYPHDRRDYYVVDINDKEFWTIEGLRASSEVMIRLTYDDRITPNRLLNDMQTLAVLAWDTGQSQWISLDGVVDYTDKSITSIVEMQSSYAAFTLGTIHDNEPIDEDLIIYNAVNPNDTGGNDHLRFEGLENYPNNTVRVYNRWGVMVFDGSNYGSNDNVFRGISNGRTTIARGKELPEGTYFYTLRYFVPGVSGSSRFIQGHLYLNR